MPNNNNLNRFDRIELLENTLFRLKQGLHKLDIEEIITFQKHMDCSVSAMLTIPALRLTTSGKGIDFLMAETSAYAEIIERISAGLEREFDIALYSQISINQSEQLQNFIAYNYMEGYKCGHQDSNSSMISIENLLRNENFDRETFDFLKMESKLLKHWVPGRSLITKKEVFVPPIFVEWISTTNGLASGNIIEEAILHACYEIFERFALISFLKDPMYSASTIHNSSIENESIQKMIKFFEDCGFNIEIKDLSSNGLFPVYAVMFFNKNVSNDSLMYNTIKAGASFNRETAIIRCFTERLQGTNIQDEIYNPTLRNTNYPNKYLSLFFEGICHIELSKYCSSQKVPFIQHRESDLSTCLNKCINIAKTMKTDLVVVDHTHPVLNFPTVRVIMPGVSDFIKWWDPDKVNRNVIGGYDEEDNKYQDKLFEVINSFWKDNNG